MLVHAWPTGIWYLVELLIDDRMHAIARPMPPPESHTSDTTTLVVSGLQAVSFYPSYFTISSFGSASPKILDLTN